MGGTIRANTKKIVCQKVTKKSRYEYSVQKDAELILALMVSSSIVQLDLSIHLKESGATATILVFVFGKNSQGIALHTLQSHEAPETRSNLLVKSALTDHAMFRYDGAIRVEKSAQKTDAYQRNENLLLSSHAHAESKPALEILANDVRCTHGATIGVLSKDQLWYLAARGIHKEEAKHMLIHGFFESALKHVSDSRKQTYIRRRLWQSI